MRFTKIRIENFGRHKLIERQFKGNVIGLSGENGMGKSTILLALELLLRGRMSGKTPGDLIRKSSIDDVKSAKLYAEFESGGVIGSITRTFYASGNSDRALVWPPAMKDGKPIKKASDVEQTLQQIIGVDQQAMASAVFIAQGTITDFMSDEAGRRKFYSQLLNLGDVKKKSEVLDGFRQGLTASVEDLGPVLDTLRGILDECLIQRDDVQQNLEETPDCQEILTLVQQAINAQQRLEEARTKLADCKSRMSHQDSGVVGRIVTEKDRLSQLLEDAKVELNQARLKETEARKIAEQISHLQSDLFIGQNRDNAVKTVEKVRAALNDTTKPGADVEAKQKSLSLTISHLLRAAELSKLIEARQSVKQNAQDQLQVLLPQIGNLEKEQERLQALGETLRDLDSRLMDLEKLRDLASGECCPMCGNTDPVEGYVQKQKDLIVSKVESIASTKSVGQALGKARSDYTQNRNNLAETTTKVNSLQQTIRDVTLELAKLNLEVAVSSSVVKANPGGASAVQEELRGLQNSLAVYHERLSACQHAEAELNRLPQPAKDVETVKKDSEALSLQRQALLVFTEVIPGLEEKERQFNHEIAVVNEQLRKFEDARAELSAAAAESESRKTLFEQASMAVSSYALVAGRQDFPELATELTRQRDERQALMTTLKTHQQSLFDAQRRVSETEEKIAQQQDTMAIIEELKQASTLLKPGGLTKEYTDYQFGRIAALAADYLAESGADYIVAPSQIEPVCYEFLRIGPGECWLPQHSMSPGQLVRLAILTIRAVHELLLPGVGLLSLDEPSTHLSTHVRETMAEMLSKMGEENLMQLIVCDHSPELQEAYTDTIMFS